MTYFSSALRMMKRKPRLFITPHAVKIRKITDEYIATLRERFEIRTTDKPVVTREEFLALCENQDAILAETMDPIDEDVVKAAGGSLKMVSISSAGYDRVDTNAMKAHGIRVGLAGSAATNSTAELAVALLLCTCRRLISVTSKYKSDPEGLFLKREEFGPVAGLEDSVVGIIGAGRIGQAVAKRVNVFQIKSLLYYSRTEKDEMRTLGGKLSSLDDIFRESDYVIVTLAHNAETNKIVSGRLLNLMKPSAAIVNVGRGGLIDQEALVEVLQNRKIGAAALDVTTPEPLPPDHPLLHLENAYISPHVGYFTSSVERKSRDLAVRNVIAFFDNDRMPEELIL